MEKNVFKDELSFGEIFGKSVDIFKENIKLIVIISLVVFIPVNVLLYLADSYLLGSDLSWDAMGNYMRIAGLLETLIGIVAYIFVMILVKKTLKGEERDFNDILKTTLKFWLPLIAVNILFGLGVMLGIILFIIPGIILATMWAFVSQHVVLNGEGISSSFTKSRLTVKGRWWEIFGYGLFSLIFVVMIGFVLGFVPYVETFIGDVVTNIIIDISYLLMVILFTVKFLNIDKSGNNKEENVEKEETKEDKTKEEIEL